MTQHSVDDVYALRVQLWDAGFRPVPVFNADADIASPGKQPLGRSWQIEARKNPPFCVTSPAVPHALNSGILCDGLRAIDIDVDDAEAAARCRSLVVQTFGEAPIRMRRNSSRCLILYRAASGEPPKIIVAGTLGKIEVLGKGQQFVAFGKHPSGADLEWFPNAPGTELLSSIPAVSEGDLHTLLSQLAPIIGAKPPRATNGHDHVPGTPQADTLRIGAALADIPNTAPPDWESWNRVGLATWRATDGSSAGFELFNAWSQRNDAYNAEETRTRWDHYKDSPPNQIGAGSIFHLAREARSTVPDEPPPPSIPPPEDLSDHDWRALIENASTTLVPSNGALPVVNVVPGDAHLMATAGEAAILHSGLPVFQRGRFLVRPVAHDVPASKGRMTVAAGFREISRYSMIDLLARAAAWERYDARAKRMKPCDPPTLVADLVLSRQGEWRVPVVAGVITTPTIRPDGSLLIEPGYDAATRMMLIGDPSLRLPHMPDRPTRADALAALSDLQSLLNEFSFVSEVDRAVALSAIITPIVRGGVPVAPMHAIGASTPGSGKSYFADVVSAASTGRPCPVMSVSARQEETDARLTGLLLAGRSIISLDNVNGELGGDLLCQAIERPIVTLRRLGASDMFDIESRATFLCTGNGLRLRGDLTRRALMCSLDPGVERPEERTFKHRPVEEVMANRGHYVACVLTVVRAYIVAGCPGVLSPLASFEEWSNLVRSALVWLKREDPAASMRGVREDDPEREELGALLAVWAVRFGTTETYTLRRIVADTAAALDWHDMREVLHRIAGTRGPGEGIDNKRLGFWVRGREGRIVGDLRLRRGEPDGHAKVATWGVAEVPRKDTPPMVEEDV